MSQDISHNLAHRKVTSCDDQEFELYVSQGSRIQGVFHVRGPIRIDGYVEGAIHTDHTVQVGKDAVIVANIYANYLVSQGPIRGDVKVRGRVELLAPARVEGSISAPKFTLEQGVQVTGMITMEQHKDGLKNQKMS